MYILPTSPPEHLYDFMIAASCSWSIQYKTAHTHIRTDKHFCGAAFLVKSLISPAILGSRGRNVLQLKVDKSRYENHSSVFCKTELWFLLDCFAPAVIVGFPDPTRGLLAADVAGLQSAALTSLQERKLISLDVDGRISIESTLAAQVETVAGAVHTVLVMERHDAELVRSYHYRPRGIASLEADGAGSWRLTSVADRQGIVERILISLLSQVFFSGEQLSVCLASETLQKAKALHMQGQVGRSVQCLAQKGMPAADSGELVSDLQSPRSHVNIAILRDRDNPGTTKTQGLVILAGGVSLWLLETCDESGQSVIVSRVSKAVLEHRVASLLP